MTTAAVFEVLYWIAIVGMSVVLVLVNAGILALGFQFWKKQHRLLGAGCWLFSLFCFYLIAIMIDKTFL
ncbi:hypothetical protein WJ0W_000430 [Paenibacillus melissococcoides]|uniref:DUF1656 domain-containing protein n=1 Tax=Paenibacillus melissococcoides TaxID=2912268 RepID=A0ABM9FVL4_9BACL|nr:MULTISPECIES: hypothetical protein [Paenibacillus]MEB9895249.1 hypothetical protein [Bacillus cereus]CAH8243204.1 hypothetical protein WJ0W_000430 [Paenibacillus melissococcoides]CAH8703955.1 hypothetical protein WDD9_000422 [Paenibacillus melissococcoides]CAH8707089.1 hypothetical protein HTL2_001506 [Paenibacillus melissococcoides]GIO82218.1 hypothetical protein J6TS7_58280 [Paenibacillus dendritiformis]